jgi:hypothetical protein
MDLEHRDDVLGGTGLGDFIDWNNRQIKALCADPSALTIENCIAVRPFRFENRQGYENSDLPD